MIEAGALDHPRVEAIFGLHVDPALDVRSIGLHYGQRNASSDTINLTVLGRSGHGAYPAGGVDAINGHPQGRLRPHRHDPLHHPRRGRPGAPLTLDLRTLFDDVEDGPAGLTFALAGNSNPDTLGAIVDAATVERVDSFCSTSAFA